MKRNRSCVWIMAAVSVLLLGGTSTTITARVAFLKTASGHAAIRTFPITAPAPQGVYQTNPAISGNLVVWLRWRNNGALTVGDIEGRNLATGRFFFVTKGTAAGPPAISGNLVVWEDCRACTVSREAWGAYMKHNVQIRGADLATGRQFLIARVKEELLSSTPAVGGRFVVWNDAYQGHNTLRGADLITGHTFVIARQDGWWDAPAMSGTVAIWVQVEAGRTRIYGKDLATGRQFVIAAHSGAQPSLRSVKAGDGTVIWTEWNSDRANQPASINGENLVTGRTFHVTTLPFGRFNPQLGPYAAVSGHIVLWEEGRSRSFTNENSAIDGKDLLTGQTFQLTPDAHEHGAPAISGRTAVWQDLRRGNWDIYGAILPVFRARVQAHHAKSPTTVSAGQPSVNVAAFRGQGRLAFLWGDRLYVLDGATQRLWTLPLSGPVDDLSWSADGRWLSYVVPGPGGAGPLWLAQADGSQAHQVMGLPAAAQFMSGLVWSPVADTLAIALNWGAAPAPGLWLVPAVGRPHRIAGAASSAEASVAWLPSGKALAYNATARRKTAPFVGDTLNTIPAAGGHPKTWFVAPGDGIRVAGWWPDGKGVLFWRDPGYSGSIAADGLALFTLPLGGTPRQVATTLAYPDWLARAPSGRELALVAGFGREIWHSKALATCTVRTGTCRALPHPHGVVMLDPAWSPRGNRIAFVQARDAGSIGGFGSGARLMAWLHTRTLWATDPRGAAVRELSAAGTGIYHPQWSRDGHHLLYVRDDALWLIDTQGGAPVKIVSSLPNPPSLFGYYGYVSWSGTFAWYQG